MTTNEQAKAGIDFIFDTFKYKLHTFQFLGAGKSACKVYDSTQREKALEDSVSLNKQGYDVFFMVNEGDGIIYDGKKIPRSQENVQQISWCYIDTDTCPIAQVQEYLSSLELFPSITIQTSPNRFHLYFAIQPFPPFEAHELSKWQAVQAIMCRLGDPLSKPLTDPSMVDYARILRVPGFQHIKKECLVKIVDFTDRPLLTIENLYSLTNAQDFEQLEASNTFEISRYLSLDAQVPVGERFPAVRAFSMHIVNKFSDKQDALNAYGQFIANKLIHADEEYLTKDRRLTQKSMSLFNSAWDVKERETRTNIKVLNSQAEDLDEPYMVTQDSEKPSFALPDSFYLNAPNGFGEVVHQVMEYSLYPCASLAFGTFLTGLSILKSKEWLTPKGSSCALYTLNIAPTGYGKNAPMSLLQNTLVSIGLGSLISNEVRSDRGLYNHLAANNGTGLLILDEIAPLLHAIQQKDANAHLANISKAFLHLYSASSMKGLSLGKVSSSNKKKGEIEIIIDNPMIAICGYTVPSQFYSLFSKTSVTEGLFQRFIPIVAEVEYVEANDNADSTKVINSPLFRPALGAEDLDQDGNPAPQIFPSTRKRVCFTPQAQTHFKELQRAYRKRLIDTARDSEQADSSGLYSRLAEQVERVATILAIGEIDLAILEYAITFLESRHRAILAVAEDTILSGEGSKNITLGKRIIEFIKSYCVQNKCSHVTKRQVYQSIRRNFQGTRHFDQIINDCVEAEEIETFTSDRKVSLRVYKIHKQ